jgi:WhiB family transcriptional regulator, redox-sensing transcriptional regulator
MLDCASIDGERACPVSIALTGPDALVLGDWCGRGLCVGANAELFFPSNGQRGAEARDICAACGVRGECLDYATGADEIGIWGGLDQDERRNRKRRWQRRQAAAALADVNRTGGAS